MADEETAPLPEDWRRHRAEYNRLNDLAAQNLIRDILSDGAPQSFHFAIGRIMERLREENTVLASEVENTIPHVAWAARNIMELRIWARFVCQSQTSLSRFVNDLAPIGASTIRAQIRLVNDLADKVEKPIRPADEQYKQLARIQESRTVAGLEGEGPLMARTYAKVVGLEKEYLALSATTSPLIHPSAVSVLRTFDIECYRDSLVGHGTVNASELIIDMRKHIELYGFRPAK